MALGNVTGWVSWIVPIAIVVSVVVVVVAVISVVRWYRAPQECWRARVVAKRTNPWGSISNLRDTTYHVTFRNEAGEELELTMRNGEFARLSLGDLGNLRFRAGTFLTFHHQR
jgi:Protein of unknown function (DUF2500)